MCLEPIAVGSLCSGEIEGYDDREGDFQGKYYVKITLKIHFKQIIIKIKLHWFLNNNVKVYSLTIL